MLEGMHKRFHRWHMSILSLNGRRLVVVLLLKRIEHRKLLAVAPSAELGRGSGISVGNKDVAGATGELADLEGREGCIERGDPGEVMGARAPWMARPWRIRAGGERAEAHSSAIQDGLIRVRGDRVITACHEQQMMQLPACQVLRARTRLAASLQRARLARHTYSPLLIL